MASDTQLYQTTLEKMMAAQEPGVRFKNIPRAEAEQLVRELGNGSYVVRPSRQPGSLSVTFNSTAGVVGHTLIEKAHNGWAAQNSANGYPSVRLLIKNEFYGIRLEDADDGVDRLSSLPTKKQHAPALGAGGRRASGHFQPTGGATDNSIVDVMRMTEVGIDFRPVSRDEAEKLLVEMAPGAHIVRPSPHPGTAVCSYRSAKDSKIDHVLLSKVEGMWGAEGHKERAPTIRGLMGALADEWGLVLEKSGSYAAAAPSDYLTASTGVSRQYGAAPAAPDGAAAAAAAADDGPIDYGSIKPEAADQFADCDYWCPQWNRAQCEDALMGEIVDTGLLRPSSMASVYAVVSYYRAGTMFHTPLSIVKGKYKLQGSEELFDAPEDIFKHLDVKGFAFVSSDALENQYDYVPKELLGQQKAGGLPGAFR